jgi:hypothetical protein
VRHAAPAVPEYPNVEGNQRLGSWTLGSARSGC